MSKKKSNKGGCHRYDFGSVLGKVGSGLEILGSAAQKAKGLDITPYLNMAKSVGGAPVNAASNEALLNAYSSAPQLKTYKNKYEITGGNLFTDILGGVGSVAVAADAGDNIFSNGGNMYGIGGAIIGGAVDAIGQIIGAFNTNRNLGILNNQIEAAQGRQTASLDNARRNIQNTQLGNFAANYIALGGPLDYDITKDLVYAKQLQAQGKGNNMLIPAFNTPEEFAKGGKIHIKPSKRGTFTAAAKKHGKSVQAFASQVLANPENYSPAMRKKANFARNASKWHADGGLLNSDFFDNGVTLINQGGTHENNPHEGVQMGIAPDGKPNLVEEGEAIYNDYVFSNRLRVPKEVRNKYKLRGPKDMTFAEAFRQAQKESQERENDPISKNGLENIAMILARTQEAVRDFEKAKEAHKAALGGHLFSGLENTPTNYILLSAMNPPRQTVASPFVLNPQKPKATAAARRNNILYDRTKERDYFNSLYQEGSDYMNALNSVLSNGNEAQLVELLRRINSGEFDNKETGEAINGSTVTRGDLYRLATDFKKGPVHNAIMSMIAQTKAAPINPAVLNNIIEEEETVEDINDAAKGTYEATFGEPQEYIAETPAKKETIVEEVKEKEQEKKTPEFENIPLSNLRYIEPFANMAAVTSDLLGYTNTPTQFNYIPAFSAVGFNPLGNYIAPTYFDTRYAANRQAQQAAATRNAIMQNIAPSRLAELLASDYNAQVAEGDMLMAAAQQQYANELQRSQFNRGTDQYNSEGNLRADLANQNARLNYAQAALHQAQLADQAQTLAYMGRAQNLGNLAESVANMGREKDAKAWRDMLIKAGVFGTLPAAKGGKLRKKKKGLTY